LKTGCSSGLTIFNKALTIGEDRTIQLASQHIAKYCIWFEKQGRFQEALTYDMQSVGLEELFNMGVGMAYYLPESGPADTKLHAFDKANEFLQKRNESSRSINAKNILRDVLKTNATCSTCKAGMLRLFATQGCL